MKNVKTTIAIALLVFSGVVNALKCPTIRVST